MRSLQGEKKGHLSDSYNVVHQKYGGIELVQHRMWRDRLLHRIVGGLRSDHSERHVKNSSVWEKLQGFSAHVRGGWSGD